MSFIFEIIKCVDEVILSQCVLDAIRVNMDITLSMLRIDFYLYRLIARSMPLSEITALGEKFCDLPGSMLDKLKCLHSFNHFARILGPVRKERQFSLSDDFSRLDFTIPSRTSYSASAFPAFSRVFTTRGSAKCFTRR